MTILVAPEDEAKVAEMLETGDNVDFADVIHDALTALEKRRRTKNLRDLLDEGDASYALGEFVDLMPLLLDEIWIRAERQERHGSPVPSYVRA